MLFFWIRVKTIKFIISPYIWKNFFGKRISKNLKFPLPETLWNFLKKKDEIISISRLKSFSYQISKTIIWNSVSGPVASENPVRRRLRCVFDSLDHVRARLHPVHVKTRSWQNRSDGQEWRYFLGFLQIFFRMLCFKVWYKEPKIDRLFPVPGFTNE